MVREIKRGTPGRERLWFEHGVIVVSPILKRVVYPWLANSGYLRRRADGGAFCVLTYHGVLPAGYEVGVPQQDGSLVSAENLRGQLQLLKECYHVVSLDEVRDWVAGGKELPERAVLLTCDDGLRNVLTDMTPILREEGVSCLFIRAGCLSRARGFCGTKNSIFCCWRHLGETTISSRPKCALSWGIGRREEPHGGTW